jgi:hypothetical protein
LLADLAQAATSPALPAEVKTAITAILALQIPTDSPITAQVLKAAVVQSGLFLEAHLAQSTSTGQTPPTDLKAALLILQRALAAVPVTALPAGSPVADAQPSRPIAPAIPNAPATPVATPVPAATTLALQPSPVATVAQPAAPEGPVTAQFAEAVATPAGQVADAEPAPVAAPAQNEPPTVSTAVPAGDVPLRAPTTPATPPPISSTSTAAPSPTLAEPVRATITQAAIAQAPALQAPQGQLGPQVAEAVVAGAQQEADLPPLAPPPEEPSPDIRAAILALQRAAASVLGAHPPVALRSAVPPPPLRQSLTSAQAAEPADLPAGDEAAVVQHLSSETDQALARLTLHQLASLPEAAGGPAWIFELPFATPQGAAMAQFAIDHDEEAAAGQSSSQAWRTRFSIDVEPLGPVHVHLRVSHDGDAAVTIWAERQAGVERLRHEGPALAQALSADVVIHPGAPRRSSPLPGPGQFVDQSS